MSAMAQKPRKRRGPKKVTAKSLNNVALHYLERFATSAENLRRVLLRRVERSAYAHGTDREEGAEQVAEIIARFRESGLLDDRAYAETQARNLFQRGGSARAIRAKLRQKGLADADIGHGLDALKIEAPNPELTAAMALARRRRLGPYRTPDARAEKRERDLAALARAGFSYGMARRVIEAETAAELEAEVEAGGDY